MKDEYEDLNSRLRNVILETCNKIGCQNCDLKWTENGVERCSALELQSKLAVIHLGRYHASLMTVPEFVLIGIERFK